jgi:hypothetical protein
LRCGHSVHCRMVRRVASSCSIDLRVCDGRRRLGS